MQADRVAGSTGNAVATLPPKTAAALQRYRISAFVVGVGLLILVATMILKYGFDIGGPTMIWGPIHGVLYIAYVLLAFDLSYRERWSIKGLLGVLVAGVIPVLSFVVERRVHRKVLARERL